MHSLAEFSFFHKELHWHNFEFNKKFRLNEFNQSQSPIKILEVRVN